MCLNADSMQRQRRHFLAAAIAVAAAAGLSIEGGAARNSETNAAAPGDARQAKLAYKRRITDAKYRYKDAVLKAKQVYARNSDGAAYERSIAAAKKRYRTDVHKAKEELHRSLGALEASSKRSSR